MFGLIYCVLCEPLYTFECAYVNVDILRVNVFAMLSIGTIPIVDVSISVLMLHMAFINQKKRHSIVNDCDGCHTMTFILC